MADTIRNVFISHIHEDDDRINELVRLIEQQDYKVRNGSITSADPNRANDENYIKNEYLAPGINWAGTVLVLISSHTKESDYVDWEIEYGAKKGKRIIGVWDRGFNGVEIPQALDKYHDAVVGWDGPTIVGAIEGTINTCVNSDGKPRPPRPISRHDCGPK